MSAESLSTLRKRNRVNPMAGMTAAEKNAYLTTQLLGYRGQTHNFTTTPTPSKPIHTAPSWMRTV